MTDEAPLIAIIAVALLFGSKSATQSKAPGVMVPASATQPAKKARIPR